MVDKDREKAVKIWLKKARINLKEAEEEFNKGIYYLAISILYYAVFYIITAYATLKGERFRKHQGVLNFFSKEVARKNLIQADFSLPYELYSLREHADYSIEMDFDPKEIKKLLSQTEEFITQMERLIKKEMETG